AVAIPGRPVRDPRTAQRSDGVPEQDDRTGADRRSGASRRHGPQAPDAGSRAAAARHRHRYRRRCAPRAAVRSRAADAAAHRLGAPAVGDRGGVDAVAEDGERVPRPRTREARRLDERRARVLCVASRIDRVAMRGSAAGATTRISARAFAACAALATVLAFPPIGFAIDRLAGSDATDGVADASFPWLALFASSALALVALGFALLAWLRWTRTEAEFDALVATARRLAIGERGLR